MLEWNIWLSSLDLGSNYFPDIYSVNGVTATALVKCQKDCWVLGLSIYNIFYVAGKQGRSNLFPQPPTKYNDLQDTALYGEFQTYYKTVALCIKNKEISFYIFSQERASAMESIATIHSKCLEVWWDLQRIFYCNVFN